MINLIKRLIKWALSAAQYRRFQERTWRYVFPLIVDYCPVVLPWFPGARSHSPAARVHRLATSFHWRRDWSPITAFVVTVATLRWPLSFAVGATRAFRTYAAGVQARYGISKWAQIKGLAKYGFGHNIPGLYYYRYRLFDPANGARAPLYIHPGQIEVLYPMLKAHSDDDRPLAIKDQFCANARMRGLPVPQPVGVFAEGKVAKWYEADAGQLPSSDLVLKPVDMACGRGFERWSYHEATRTWQRGDRQLNAAEFVKHCCDVSNDHGRILQVRLRNHRDLLSLSGDALSTIRLVTYRRPSSEQGILLGCLRMGTGASHVDNFEAGGMAALIDPQTATLGVAVAKDPRRGPFTHHPDSGAAIVGARVPHYADAVALVLEAHRQFPWMPFVGWDVVITDDGPMLLEANTDWCVQLAQIVMDRPLGQTLFPEIFLEHVTALQQAARSDPATPAVGAMALPEVPPGI